MRSLLFVALIGCTKPTADPPKPQAMAATAAHGIDALSVRADAAPEFAKLVMPPAERGRITDIYKADPKQVLSVRGLTRLSGADAQLLASWSGKVLDLSGVVVLDAATAQQLATWPGEVLFLGVTAIDAATATALAAWKGRSLHLDQLTIDVPVAKALAAFSGDTLGLAHGDPAPEAVASLVDFKGSVALAFDRGPRFAPTVATPPAESAADLATLGRISGAIDDGDIAAVKEFLKAGGAVDMNEHGTTLLMEATNLKQLEISRVLVAAHASVNAVSSTGMTPLYYALDDS